MTGMGGAIQRPDEFNESRWLRAGASPIQLKRLEDAFNALDYDQRVAENIRISSVSDGELAQHLSVLPAAPDVVPAAQPAENITDAGLPSGGQSDDVQ